MVRLSVYGLNIILETDNPGVRYMLEYDKTEQVYNIWTKSWVTKTGKGKIYNKSKTDSKRKLYYFEIGVGFAAYLLKYLKMIIMTFVQLYIKLIIEQFLFLNYVIIKIKTFFIV